MTGRDPRRDPQPGDVLRQKVGHLFLYRQVERIGAYVRSVSWWSDNPRPNKHACLPANWPNWAASAEVVKRGPGGRPRRRGEVRKEQELVSGCMSKARPGEMTFVLLGRDIAAPAAIREWCRLRCLHGKNKPTDAQITEALECADTMEYERNAA